MPLSRGHRSSWQSLYAFVIEQVEIRLAKNSHNGFLIDSISFEALNHCDKSFASRKEHPLPFISCPYSCYDLCFWLLNAAINDWLISYRQVAVEPEHRFGCNFFFRSYTFFVCMWGKGWTFLMIFYRNLTWVSKPNSNFLPPHLTFSSKQSVNIFHVVNCFINKHKHTLKP